MRRVVVTGLGAVTPLAAGVEASWSRLLAGRSGIRRLPDDVVGDLPGKVGGVVPSTDEDSDAGFDPDAVLAPKDQRKLDRRRDPRARYSETVRAFGASSDGAAIFAGCRG
jgi:3-oxoacyl-[acyl-carrier-protein] synthase II